MTSIDDLKHDVQSIGDKQLSELATEERLRLFIKAAADDEIAATGELMQEYDLDDMVEAEVTDLIEELEDAPMF